MRAARATGIAFNVGSNKRDCTLGFRATCGGSARLWLASPAWRLAKLREHDSILRSVTPSKLFIDFPNPSTAAPLQGEGLPSPIFAGSNEGRASPARTPPGSNCGRDARATCSRALDRQNTQFNHRFRPFILCGLSSLGLWITVRIHLAPEKFREALLYRLPESSRRT